MGSSLAEGSRFKGIGQQLAKYASKTMQKVRPSPEARAAQLVQKMKKFDPHVPNRAFAAAAAPSTMTINHPGKFSRTDVLDAAAVVAGRKPLAGVNPISKQEHKQAMAVVQLAQQRKKNLITAPRSEGGFYFGKRKNVHKALRIDHFTARNPEAHGAWNQYGANLGYPLAKIRLFNIRARKRGYLKANQNLRRYDRVDSTIPRRSIGPKHRLPESLTEGSLLYDDPDYRKAVQQLTKDVLAHLVKVGGVQRSPRSWGGDRVETTLPFLVTLEIDVYYRDKANFNNQKPTFLWNGEVYRSTHNAKSDAQRPLNPVMKLTLKYAVLVSGLDPDPNVDYDSEPLNTVSDARLGMERWVAFRRLLKQYDFQTELYSTIAHELIHALVDTHPPYNHDEAIARYERKRRFLPHHLDPHEKRAILMTSPAILAVKHKELPRDWATIQKDLHGDAHIWREKNPELYKKYLKNAYVASRSKLNPYPQLPAPELSLPSQLEKTWTNVDRAGNDPQLERLRKKEQIVAVRKELDSYPGATKEADRALRWSTRRKRQGVIKGLMNREFEKAREGDTNISREDALKIALDKYKTNSNLRSIPPHSWDQTMKILKAIRDKHQRRAVDAMIKEDMDFAATRQAVHASNIGRATPNHVIALRKARDTIRANKSHPAAKSPALMNAIRKHLGEAVTDYLPAREHVKQTAQALRQKAARVSRWASAKKGEVSSPLGNVSLGQNFGRHLLTGVSNKLMRGKGTIGGATYLEKGNEPSIWVNPKLVRGKKASSNVTRDILTHEYVHAKNPSTQKAYEARSNVLNTLKALPHEIKKKGFRRAIDQLHRPIEQQSRSASRHFLNAERMGYTVGSAGAAAEQLKAARVPFSEIRRDLHRGGPRLLGKHVGFIPGVNTHLKGAKLNYKQRRQHRNKMRRNLYLASKHAYSDKAVSGLSHKAYALHTRINDRAGIKEAVDLLVAEGTGYCWKQLVVEEKTLNRVKQIAKLIGADKVDLKQLRRGMKVEREHGDRNKKTDVIKQKDADSDKVFAKIALAHLKEIPDYYTRLDKMEKQGKKAAKKTVKEAVDQLFEKNSEAENEKEKKKVQRRRMKRWALGVAVGAAGVAGSGLAVYKHLQRVSDIRKKTELKDRVKDNIKKSQEEREKKWMHIPPGVRSARADIGMRGLGLHDVNQYRYGKKDRTIRGIGSNFIRNSPMEKSVQRYIRKHAIKEAVDILLEKSKYTRAQIGNIMRRAEVGRSKDFVNFKNWEKDDWGAGGYPAARTIQKSKKLFQARRPMQWAPTNDRYIYEAVDHLLDGRG